jgi:hypothetical protein
MILYNLSNGDVTKAEAVYQTEWYYIHAYRRTQHMINQFHKAHNEIIRSKKPT